jgi:hypothetical protein
MFAVGEWTNSEMLYTAQRRWEWPRRTEIYCAYKENLCGLVVRVPGYRPRGPGSIPERYKIFWEVVGQERGPFSLVSTTEELLERKSSGSGLENLEYGRRCLSG